MQKQKKSLRALLLLPFFLLTQVFVSTPSLAQNEVACQYLFAFVPAHSAISKRPNIKPTKLHSSAAALRNTENIPSLRVMTYNVKNLFYHVGDFERVTANKFQKVKKSKEKPKTELIGVAEAINESHPDIVVLQEIEGSGSLDSFNDNYLHRDYQTFLTPGNDGRGIEVGFLLKKDLPLKVIQETHRDVLWHDPADHDQEVPLFSRDLPTLIFYRLKDDPKSATPLLIVIGNHGKSKRDRPGDPESTLLRTAQYEGASKIVEAYIQHYGPNVPLLMAGDFNTDVRTASEVESIRKELKDVFDLTNLPKEQRITHTFHPYGSQTKQSQLDAVMVSEGLAHSILDASIYRYKDANGNPKPLPKSYAEREGNPSDHYPIIVDISTDVIFPEAHPNTLQKAVGSP